VGEFSGIVASVLQVKKMGNGRATPNFDVLARFYRWMEWATFGPFLARCRLAFMNKIRASKRALVIGDGDGRFAARLLTENHEVRVKAIDASAAMLEALVARTGSESHRVSTARIDAREWRPARTSYDLVVTHFFLDCLSTDEVRALADRVGSAAAPGALWVVSEFAIPDSLFGRLVAVPLVSLLYTAFCWITGLQVRELPDHSFALQESGFKLSECKVFLSGLLVSELWEFRPSESGPIKKD
jgi:ubiquinone/menaquinone biosynthesis C-methylase UbiE